MTHCGSSSPAEERHVFVSDGVSGGDIRKLCTLSNISPTGMIRENSKSIRRVVVVFIKGAYLGNTIQYCVRLYNEGVVV